MSKSKHTAGDWRVGGGGLNILATRDDGKPVLIGTAYIANDPAPSFKDRKEAEANARLMAAAPKLLAACYKVLDAISDLSDDARAEFDESAVLAITAAIALAEVHA